MRRTLKTGRWREQFCGYRPAQPRERSPGERPIGYCGRSDGIGKGMESVVAATPIPPPHEFERTAARAWIGARD